MMVSRTDPLYKKAEKILDRLAKNGKKIQSKKISAISITLKDPFMCVGVQMEGVGHVFMGATKKHPGDKFHFAKGLFLALRRALEEYASWSEGDESVFTYHF